MNRLNLQSADPRKISSTRNAMPFNNSGLANVSNENTDEFVSADLNMAGNSNVNQVGHDHVNLDTQSRDEIFQVNNLIKNTQINNEDTEGNGVRTRGGGRVRGNKGSDLYMNSYHAQDESKVPARKR